MYHDSIKESTYKDFLKVHSVAISKGLQKHLICIFIVRFSEILLCYSLINKLLKNTWPNDTEVLFFK